MVNARLQFLVTKIKKYLGIKIMSLNLGCNRVKTRTSEMPFGIMERAQKQLQETQNRNLNTLHFPDFQLLAHSGF